MNYEGESLNTASGYVFRVGRFHTTGSILDCLDDLMFDNGMGFVDDPGYNPEGDPVFKITITVERQ